MPEDIITIATVLIYLVITLAIGIVYSRSKVTTAANFWLADRSVPTWINGVSIFAVSNTAGALLGVAGLVASGLLAFFLITSAGMMVGLLFGAVTLAPMLRRRAVFTLPEYFLKRYGRYAAGVGALVTLIFLLAFIVAQVRAAGLAMSFVTGVDLWVSVIGISVVFVAYTAFGGMRAVTSTDFLQGLVVIVVLAVGLVALFGEFGFSLSEFRDRTFGAMPEMGVRNLPLISHIGGYLIWGAGIVSMPHLIARMLTSRSPSSARNATIFGVAINVFMYVVVFAPLAIAGAALWAGEVDPNLSFLATLEFLFSPVLAGAAIAALLALTMSSVDSMLLACTSTILQDLTPMVRSRFRAASSGDGDAHHGFGTRLAIMLVIGVVTTAAAIPETLPLIAQLVGLAIGGFGATLFFPIIIGLLWRGATQAGAVAGMLGGLVSYLGLHISGALPPFGEGAIAIPLSGLLVMAVSLLAPESAPATEPERRLEAA